MMCRITLSLSFLFLFVMDLWSSQITLYKIDATVWGQDQVIEGTLSTPFANEGTLVLNGAPQIFDIDPTDGTFRVPIRLGEGVNTIVIKADSVGSTMTSQTLRLTLGYSLRPEVFAWATVSGRTVMLHSAVVENPGSSTLTYMWSADPDNPGPVDLGSTTDSTALLTLGEDVPFGEYYFDLDVTESDGDVGKARTFVTVDSSVIRPFNIRTDHAAWIDQAIIYEITPCDFVLNGRLSDIEDKIPDLVDLGVNTIWLQPIFVTDDVGGHGYLVTDYFNVRNEVGAKEDLRRLVQAAHDWGLKLILDTVPNHTSINHPYAEETKQYGTDSHYYDFYQRDASEVPGVPYSDQYQTYQGFVNYFWNWLANLNFDNPEVQRWMTEACRYWIEEFDIDGYRFDAVWGVNARKPEYTKELRLALKRIKPEILMLAEDKATWPMVFDERFDAAFDWTPEEEWVSHWSWQMEYRNYTIFNGNYNDRASLLENALTNSDSGYDPRAKILRFMENNDLSRFIQGHGLERTKMVAAFMFALNGIPLIFNGQEIGFSEHPYATRYIFDRSGSIQSQDDFGLYAVYKQLIGLRKTFRSLTNENLQILGISASSDLFAFRRWEGNENIFVVMNMSESEVNARLTLPIQDLAIDSAITYYFSDLIHGEVIPWTIEESNALNLPMEGYQTCIFLFADSAYTTLVEHELASQHPETFELRQNYPNPFNAKTMIHYTLPIGDKIRLTVYDILGRETETLVDKYQGSGSYAVQFNASHYASGIYVYRLECGGHVLMKKMMLVK